MHIIVCLKQIIDPEIPPHLFQLDPVQKTQVQGVQSLVISTFDEVALEAALQLKEKTAGTTVTALTIAGPTGTQALHTALAMGADQAVLLSDPAFEQASERGKAHILAAAIQRLAPYDLVLCGRQAGDVEHGLVGPFLAEALGLPCLTLVSTVVSTENGTAGLQLNRPVEGGYEIFTAPAVDTPLLLTVTNDESNIPRYASVLGIRKAMRQQIPTWTAADLELDPAGLHANGHSHDMHIADLFIPERQSQCDLIDGDSAAEKAQALVQRLRERHLV